MDYTIIKSKRKTLALQIKGEALIVRAPLKMSEREIERFITEHSEWIEKHLKKSRERIEKAKKVKPLTDLEIAELSQKAKSVFAERVLSSVWLATRFMSSSIVVSTTKAPEVANCLWL